ncbi:MAG: fructose-1,6-bisphosphatase [Clostridia bacterium]|uniref:fructose-1,6-bisphosphatase n=1 Tax=Pumilibacter muris TaxID=2941510 RepID=UPI00203C89CC|nr:fructose-1,6-bisphosphatase [Pumilibacter muris]MCI8596316.1 fructose-1,6-bisphosphatase [Clostridia bacterium]
MDGLTEKLFGERFPTAQDAVTEIINLEAILRLPKGTEHFLSDLHGEYGAFCHLMNSCSGVIRAKIDELFGKLLSSSERSELATTVYYPAEKIEAAKNSGAEMSGWYKTMLYRLTLLARECGKKYTRSKVRKAMPPRFDYIIDEMLHSAADGGDREAYYDEIFSEIIKLGCADTFLETIAALIKRLAIDRLHIVGDVFDRGENPDKIMDILCSHHSIDFQWGNHDILWMGAFFGSRACVATVVELCLKYGNLELLEMGYGISLRELAFFADKQKYEPKFAINASGKKISETDAVLSAKMRKAIFIMLLKLEGQAIARHPEYGMENRSLLKKIDLRSGTVEIDGMSVKIDASDFATLHSREPLKLTAEEENVLACLVKSFTGSEKLRRHVGFLMNKGSIYSVCNGNLIFHGCIPLDENGDFLPVAACGNKRGKACMDEFVRLVKRAAASGKEKDTDVFWYLWCGSGSPLFGRKKLATFESIYLPNSKLCAEEKNPYYTLSRKREVAQKILAEFGLSGEHCRIINGHIPVHFKEGENPVKANGKLVVIDGGFCRAYHERTGIAGYTLIYNSYGMRLAAHSPFCGVEEAIASNRDIISNVNVFDTVGSRLKVADTDTGENIRSQIAALKTLLKEKFGKEV